MSDKCIWTRADTSLLLSLWSDRSVQKNLQDTPRNVAIWYAIARYMRKRGIDVNWLQCRQRMKRLVGRYRKIKRGASLKLKNMTDSFFQELDLVFNQSHVNLEPDSSVYSSSLDVSNEATTAVETLLREPQFVNIDNPLELKEPKIEPTGRKPSTRSMAKPSRQIPKPTLEECVSDISPSDVNSVEVAFQTKCVPVLRPSNQKAKYLDSNMPLTCVNSTNSDNRTKSGSEEKDSNCVTKQATGTTNESETITKVLLAQAETTGRLLEANRTQQEILESRMDQIVGQLETLVPVSNQGIIKKLEMKLDSVLNKLDQIITHTNVQTPEQTLHTKIEVVLERLEHILPYIEQYNSSAPTLVDKIDSLLTGMDKVAPYAYNLIEVNTEEQS